MYPPLLNLGCGFDKKPGWLNVDLYDNCKPDMVMDLNKTPWPFPDETFQKIYAHHVFEHIGDNWWEAFKECARILKMHGELEIHVPDESNAMALTYRDHKRVFGKDSFHGIYCFGTGNNAWAQSELETVPLVLRAPIIKVPYPRYRWIERWFPWAFEFCAEHMRNFVWEQIFMFYKIERKDILPDREEN